MFGTTPIHIRLARATGATAAAAVLLVPPASAARQVPHTLAPGGTTASRSSFITDTLAPGGSSAPAGGYRFITDTLAPGGGAGGTVTVRLGSGFSWADAGIGAAVSCGLLLFALATRQLVARRRRRQLAF